MNVATIKEALKYYDDKAELEVLSNGKVIGFAIEIGGDKDTPYLEARVDNSITVTQHIEDIPKKTFNMLGGGLVTPFITTQSLGDINPYLQDLLLNENFIPYNLTKPPKANYILFQLKKDLLSEQFIWEIEKPLVEQNDETKQAILDVL